MKNIVTYLPLGTYFTCLLEEKDKVKLPLCKNANDLQMQEKLFFLHDRLLGLIGLDLLKPL